MGSVLLSWGIPHIAAQVAAIGVKVETFDYTDAELGLTRVKQFRKEGCKIALLGYSLGNTTTTYIQSLEPVDLLLGIAESEFGWNHPLNKKNTKRACLWYGPGLLSCAGTTDPGWDRKQFILEPHLLMDTDPVVCNGVIEELKLLGK